MEAGKVSVLEIKLLPSGQQGLWSWMDGWEISHWQNGLRLRRRAVSDLVGDHCYFNYLSLNLGRKVTFTEVYMYHHSVRLITILFA